MIFPNDIREDFEPSIEHIHREELRRLMSAATHEAVLKLLDLIVSNPMNLPVKKRNMCAYSYVHKGDNKWVLEMDCNVYPVLGFQYTSFIIQLYNDSISLSLKNYCDVLCDAFQHFQNLQYREIKNKDAVRAVKKIMGKLKLAAYNRVDPSPGHRL